MAVLSEVPFSLPTYGGALHRELDGRRRGYVVVAVARDAYEGVTDELLSLAREGAGRLGGRLTSTEPTNDDIPLSELLEGVADEGVRVIQFAIHR